MRHCPLIVLMHKAELFPQGFLEDFEAYIYEVRLRKCNIFCRKGT